MKLMIYQKVYSIKIRIKTNVSLHCKEDFLRNQKVYSIKIRIKTTPTVICFIILKLDQKVYSIKIRIKTYQHVKDLFFGPLSESIFH